MLRDMGNENRQRVVVKKREGMIMGFLGGVFFMLLLFAIAVQTGFLFLDDAPTVAVCPGCPMCPSQCYLF